jgi:hypothetical protein
MSRASIKKLGILVIALFGGTCGAANFTCVQILEGDLKIALGQEFATQGVRIGPLAHPATIYAATSRGYLLGAQGRALSAVGVRDRETIPTREPVTGLAFAPLKSSSAEQYPQEDSGCILLSTKAAKLPVYRFQPEQWEMGVSAFDLMAEVELSGVPSKVAGLSRCVGVGPCSVLGYALVSDRLETFELNGDQVTKLPTINAVDFFTVRPIEGGHVLAYGKGGRITIQSSLSTGTTRTEFEIPERAGSVLQVALMGKGNRTDEMRLVTRSEKNITFLNIEIGASRLQLREQIPIEGYEFQDFFVRDDGRIVFSLTQFGHAQMRSFSFDPTGVQMPDCIRVYFSGSPSLKGA